MTSVHAMHDMWFANSREVQWEKYVIITAE